MQENGGYRLSLKKFIRHSHLVYPSYLLYSILRYRYQPNPNRMLGGIFVLLFEKNNFGSHP